MTSVKDLVYGIALATIISKVLGELKHTDQDITVFLIYDIILASYPDLQAYVNPNKIEKEKFYRRIRNCLNALVDRGMLERQEHTTKTKTIYYIYIVKF